MSEETKSPPAALQNARPEQRAFLLWAADRGTPEWLLAAARHKADWPEGREVSEADYDEAIKSAESEVIT